MSGQIETTPVELNNGGGKIKTLETKKYADLSYGPWMHDEGNQRLLSDW